MQTTTIGSDGNLQAALDKLSGGNRLVIEGEHVGAYSVPESAEGSEIVLVGAIDGRDEFPKGALDMHNGGKGYAEGNLLTVRPDNVTIYGNGSIVNSRGSGLRMVSEKDCRIDGLNIRNVRWQLFRIEGKNHIVRNIVAKVGGTFNTSDRSGSVENWCNGGTAKDVENCTFENIEVSDHYGEGFGITGKGNTCKNFIIHNTFSGAFYVNNSGELLVDGLLMWQTGEILRGGNVAGGLTFGLESNVPKQGHRPDTNNIVVRNVVGINCGPAIAFRGQRANGVYEDILVENGTFYESREKPADKSVGIWFNPQMGYRNVAVRGCVFVQSVGKLTNRAMVDLGGNVLITNANMLPQAKQQFTGNLGDYLFADKGAKLWPTKFNPRKWQAEQPPVEPDPIEPDPVKPTEPNVITMDRDEFLSIVEAARGLHERIAALGG